MSKLLKFLLLLTFAALQQIYFIPYAFAVPNCIDSDMTYSAYTSPDSSIRTNTGLPLFYENSSIITLNFNVKPDSNVFKNSLSGKEVRLNFAYGIIPGQSSLSVPATVSSPNFTLSLTEENLRGRGEHWGRLEFKNPSNNKFEEFCTDIKYQVGIINNKCEIDPRLEAKMPPNTTIPSIKFIGAAEREYTLVAEKKGATGQTNFGTIKTSRDGQGRFDDVSIPSTYANGDKVVFRLFSLKSELVPCEKEIILDATAPLPKTPSAGPIIPGGATGTGAGCTPGDPNCTKAAGIACNEGKGIETAIGCVPIDPSNLVTAFLRLAVGIAGGIAFLLMLFGSIQMITSAGNPDGLKAGQERFSSAIIGLLFIIFSVLFLKIIGVDILGLERFFGP